jgi:RNA ligase
MMYSFPHITHIDDVLPAIKDSPEFIVAQKDGYQVVNYVVATHDTFPDVATVGLTNGNVTHRDIYEALADFHAAVRRECRGLVFDLDGKLINRRYHKFFNVNERDETAIHAIDWSRPHVILEKLDGSMVSPCFVHGHLRWMTKMGLTDTSMEAEVFVASRPDYAEFARHYLKYGFTPIFEWCSNKNRIVLDYPEDRLVLTAMRENDSGNYLLQDALERIGEHYGIEVVKAYDVSSSKHPSHIIDMVRAAEDAEGVVVRFDDGHMVKIKSDWYVRIHKIKSLLGQERDVVSLILNNQLDDMLPVLPREDVERVEALRVDLGIDLHVASVELAQDVIKFRSEMDRKTFALEYASKMNAMWRGLIFQFWDKECDEHLTYQAIVAMILKNCGSNASYAKVKEAFLKDVDYV